ncbi:hypothetical protein Tsubulata_049859 [Turnera subulata]|uniref:Dirigent protein n=1 Tax=Turnera subulata TaxID=218843 RepID=A0A9Q0J2J1_9ROSI|nr:hypothetical protein Tsubulata_049859 [Turnera subulata]
MVASQILNHLLFSSFMVMAIFMRSSMSKFSEQFPSTVSIKRMEKMTRFHFYFHDIHSGKTPTAVRIIARAQNGGAGNFGTTFMMDNPLTEEQEPESKLVGRAQGMYAFASLHDPGLLMVLNLAFVEGMYNGSSISILGRNPVLENVREMPVVGGSGLFRFARGCALAKTITYNPKTNDAVVEYNVSVVHF